jgi:hypothetical protein
MRAFLATLALFVARDFGLSLAAACTDASDCPAGQACTAGVCVCPPGSYVWVRGGFVRCRLCAPGCACPGALAPCLGCSAGYYSATPGAAACEACLPGTTSDAIFNSGCDPENYETPCANRHGPLGQVACRPDPPPQNITFVAPNGAIKGVAQYLPDGVPNKVPPYYDIDGLPMVQQSY